MLKRKRMAFDPPSNRKKKRRRKAVLHADQIFLTRRMFLAKGVLVAAFAGLATRLGFMQIVQQQEFKKLADGNRFHHVNLKAPRGMIVDREGRILADNRRSWQVRVTPAELPADETEKQSVLDTLIQTLGLPDALVVRPSSVPRGSEETVYRRIAMVLERDPEKLIPYITREAPRNILVIIEEDLTADQAATLRAASAQLPGASVINLLEYLVTNVGNEYLPVTVKTDVPREVALKLAVDRLYLPGVELDDSALVRTYHGGEVMSHLLGYVSQISEEDLKDPENLKSDKKTPLPYYSDYNDIIGRDGVERTFESLLRGTKGQRWVEVDASGTEQREVPGETTVPKPGQNIKLTIDLELQAAASQILKEGIKFSNEDRKIKGTLRQSNAQAGAVVAIDPRTGEVLAMVSYPQYDNQLFIDGISQRKYNEYLDEAGGQPLIDRSVMSHYAPGSTLKLFIAASALNEKTINSGTKFTCGGGIRVRSDLDLTQGTTYKCWNRDGHQELDLLGAIEQSCDVFFYNVGTPKQRPDGAVEDLHYFDVNAANDLGTKHYFQGMGIEKLYTNLTKQFWFGAKTGIDLPQEAKGQVPNADWKYGEFGDYWSAGDTIITSIGQGMFLATPLQLAVNTAALANHGTIYKPQLVRETVDDRQGTLRRIGPEVNRTLTIKPEYIDKVREGMRRVVHERTGSAHHNVNLETNEESTKWPSINPLGEPEILIGGKTGTAEFGKKDDEDNYIQFHSWFTCFAPFDKPEIAVSVLVEDGGEGSMYAVPIADKVLRAYFETTGKRERGMILQKEKPLTAADATKPVGGGTTPKPGTTEPNSLD